MAMSVFSGKEGCDGLAMSATGTGMSSGGTLSHALFLPAFPHRNASKVFLSFSV